MAKTKHSAAATDKRSLHIGWSLLAILAVYIALRALAWTNTLLFEDHDSILYIHQIEAFRTFDAAVIHALSPDVTPFYPFMGAILSLPGWSAELAARLCSLVFSIVLFFSGVRILRQVSGPAGMRMGLGILAVTPFLITFSISILSEPSYVGVLYAGFAYFLWQLRSESIVHAFAIGFVFGLAFLNRLEGLLFLAVIPALKALSAWTDRRPVLDWLKATLRWSSVYAAGFVIVAAPQVVAVSDKMDRFALNGRQVWAQILLAPDAGSYEEEIYGLDFSPEEINLAYLQKHNVALPKADMVTRLTSLAETTLRNIDKFYAVQLGKLGGSLLVALFIYGLVSIFRQGQRLESILIAGFVVAACLPGILTDPKPRAVAAAVPMLALIAGPGVLQISRDLGSGGGVSRWLPKVAPGLILATLASVWIVPFMGIYLQERRQNIEYSLDDLAPVEAAVRKFSATTGKGATISSRKQYLAYFTDSEFVPLPYANYESLIDYLAANNVELLFLQHRLIEDFPFMESILAARDTPELELIYTASDSAGFPLQLYRLRFHAD